MLPTTDKAAIAALGVVKAVGRWTGASTARTCRSYGRCPNPGDGAASRRQRRSRNEGPTIRRPTRGLKKASGNCDGMCRTRARNRVQDRWSAAKRRSHGRSPPSNQASSTLTPRPRGARTRWQRADKKGREVPRPGVPVPSSQLAVPRGVREGSRLPRGHIPTESCGSERTSSTGRRTPRSKPGSRTT